MTERENMEVPLRVRISAAEDERLMIAANKLGLTKSVYVRWAIRNSTTQVIGAASDTARPAAAKPKRAKPAPAPVAEVQPEPEPEVPGVAAFFNPAAVLSGQSVVPLYVPGDGDPVAPSFDDSEWT